MWVNQDEMFGDGKDVVFRHQQEVNEETARLLDDLASRIIDGDVRVQYISQRIDDDFLGEFPVGDDYPKVLEVTYRED